MGPTRPIGPARTVDEQAVSALVGTIPAPWTAHRGPGVARWLRPLLSLLAAVGILAVALPVAFAGVGRGAGVDPVQVFSSGSLIAADASGGSQLSVAGMVPGQSRSATIRLSNGGSATTAFNLSTRLSDRVGAGGAPLSSTLILRVRSLAGGRSVYAGPLAGMPRLALGRIPAGAERAYRFTVELPHSAGNEVAGSSLRAAFAWNAV